MAKLSAGKSRHSLIVKFSSKFYDLFADFISIAENKILKLGKFMLQYKGNMVKLKAMNEEISEVMDYGN